MLTQKQMLAQVELRAAALNSMFMELVNHPTNPLTNADLVRLIEKRPEVYGRFSGFVGKLKD